MEKSVKNPFSVFSVQPGVVLRASTKGIATSVEIEGGKRYKKEIIRTGSFLKDSEELEFVISLDTLYYWASLFKTLKENGIKVPVQNGHWDSDTTYGYVVDMYVEEESLFAEMELFGEDVDTLVKTKDVSIYSPLEWTDGTGNTYVRPILHVALTAYPLIPGLKDFEELAASLFNRKEKKKMDWAKIKEVLGITEEIKDENGEELLLSAIAKMQEKAKKEKEDLVASLKEGKDSKKEKKELDPLTLSLAQDNISSKLERLVEANKVTPSVKDELQELFVGDKGSNLSLSLSNGNLNMINKIIEVMGKNDVVELGEKTGHQGILSLSDPSRAKKESPLMRDAKTRTGKRDS
jgi:hypothetical protein